MNGYDNENEETVELEGEILKILDNSILFSDGETESIIPQSMIRSPALDELEEGEMVELVIPEWLAKERGLI